MKTARLAWAVFIGVLQAELEPLSGTDAKKAHAGACTE
jgi:hypothetical protein